MAGEILAERAAGPVELLFILIISLGVLVLLTAVFIKFVLKGTRERKKLRQRMDELTKELEQMQEHRGGDKAAEPPAVN